MAIVARRRLGTREIGAVITATAWATLVLGLLHLAAPGLGWWEAGPAAVTVRGVPLELLGTRILLWGVLPALAVTVLAPLRPLAPVLVLVLVLVAVDLAVLPLRREALVLGEHWLVGQVAVVALGPVPAVALAVWTLRRRHVLLRGWAQAVAATGLLLVVPALAVATAGGGAPSSPWPWPVLVVLGALAAVVGLPTLAAMRELAVVGHGTPLPHDPPDRLVTSGPYAYVRNPMQVSISGMYAVLALLLGEPVLLLGTLAAVAFAAGPAERQERRAMGEEFGTAWDGYRAEVRAWVPRRRPWPGRSRAVLTVPAAGAGSRVGRWIEARETAALTIRPASEHRGGRLTYEGDGVRVHGVAALARSLDHAGLAWAMVGWVLALPLASPAPPTPTGPAARSGLTRGGGTPGREPRSSGTTPS